MDLEAKVAILRQHEAYCYQICYYLIQDEELSIKAAGTALLELAKDITFFTESEENQIKKVNRVTVRLSMKVKATA